MSKKIGEALIRAGLLSRRQLEQALRLQLIFGGHLGTCLVELGYVDEAALGRTLASTLGMKRARGEAFDEIPPEILRRIPRSEVRRRRVVPFGIRRDALHVATVLPNSVAGLAEIVGLKIVPYLAPEIYILRAMERYYAIPRRRRYLTVPYATMGSAPRAAAAGPVTGDAGRDLPLPPAPPAIRSVPSAKLRMGEHSRRMSRVNDHVELGEVLLDFAVERMSRSILFFVEQESAGVANWRGVEFDAKEVRQISLPVETSSIFALALEDACYRGALPQRFDCGSFYGKLGIEVPREVLVLPIYGDSRLEAVLYGDGGRDGRITGTTDSFLLLLDEVGLALRMLSYKRQLCPA